MNSVLWELLPSPHTVQALKPIASFVEKASLRELFFPTVKNVRKVILTLYRVKPRVYNAHLANGPTQAFRFATSAISSNLVSLIL